MYVIIAGPDDHDLATALERDADRVVEVSETPTRVALEAAGIASADLFVLTDPAEATAIPVARDLNPDLRVVVYAEGRLPEFARPIADLILDPRLLRPDLVAEELL